MEQEYPTSLGYKIFYGAGAAAVIIFSLVLYGVASRDNSNEYSSHPGALLFPVFGIGIAVLIIINLIKRKVTASSELVSYKSIWGYKEIPTGNIKGFRIADKKITIIPTDPGYQKIHIRDYISISYSKEFRQWLRDNFKDLDQVEFEAAKEELLQDASLGATQDDRETLFKKYRHYNLIYGIVAIAVLFVPLFLGLSNKYLSIFLLIYPAIGIFLMATSKGLIRLFAKKNSAYASIFIGLLFSSGSLIFQSVMNARILSFDKLWQPAAIIALAIGILLYFIAIIKPKVPFAGQIFFVLLISCAYAFGITLQVNCTFDGAPPHTYPAKVTNEYVSHGKSTSYHLVLGECDGFNGTETINVSRSRYNDTPLGSVVKIDMRPGTFGAAWFTIE